MKIDRARFFLPWALAMSAVLAGCASMSKTECQSADWQLAGLADGRSGLPPDYINSHQEACAKAGVTPDVPRWRVGWTEGVKSFCSPNSAWNAGLRNATYYGVCAGLDEATFLRYHRAGQLVYRARQDLSKTQAEVTKLEDDLKKASKDEERKRLRDDLHRADRERARLTALLAALELAGPPR